jgi:hypothetical protein
MWLSDTIRRILIITSKCRPIKTCFNCSRIWIKLCNPEVRLLRSFYCATVPTHKRDVQRLFFRYPLISYLNTHTNTSLIFPWFFSLATLYVHVSVVIINFRNRFMDNVLYIIYSVIPPVISLIVLINDTVIRTIAPNKQQIQKHVEESGRGVI